MEKEIQEEIKNIMFVACPTEKEEPFFWRWTEYGLNVLAGYVAEKIRQAHNEAVEAGIEAVEKINSKNPCTRHGVPALSGQPIDCGFCTMVLVLQEASEALKNLLKK